MELTPDWDCVADTVMGGVSRARIASVREEDRDATRLTGQVSLENDGGFVQMATDLGPHGSACDASAFTGVRIDVKGNGETYEVRLRTTDLTRPWQSYRAAFEAPAIWTTLDFPFADFAPHRTDRPFDPARLRRIGILAIGKVMRADIAVSRLALYRD